MSAVQINLLVGWLGMFFGAASGAVIGLFFHRREWMGGYGSFRRRLVRLGHIAFFGMGFVNLMFAFTVNGGFISSDYLVIASVSLVVAGVTMPLCCFLTAWRDPFHNFFFIPVGAFLVGCLIVLGGLPWR